MENTLNHIDELIGKYLAQEASGEERAFVETWRNQNEANRNYFNHFRLIFDQAALVKNVPHFDTDAAWTKMRSRLHQKSEAKTVALKPSGSFGLFWKIAASVLIVLSIGFFAYRLLQPGSVETIKIITETKSKADTLPGGSGVFLNRKTQLAYSFDKRENTHRVKLKGEAYFNIQHNDDKAFIVEADGALIKDIGTTFNVKAYPESNTIEVVVKEGEVLFYTESNSGITLHAGGKGVYHKDTKTFTVEEPEPNVIAYKTRFFIFSDSDLATAVQQLNTVYDKRIIIGRHLNNCRLTVSFNNENIDVIASIIAETLGLTVKSTGQGIVLEGKGCEN